MPVYKLKDRKGWYFAFYYNGKKIKKERWKNQRMDTKTFALQCEYECKQELEYGGINKNITLYELFDEYLITTKGNLKESSKNNYGIFKRNYLILIIDKKIYDITIKDVLVWKNKIIDKDVSVETKNRNICIMKQLLNYGSVVYNIKGNLQAPLLESIKDNKAIETKKELLEYIPNDDFIRLLEPLDITNKSHLYVYTILNVLYYSGLRIGELAGLEIKDYKNNTLSIAKDVVRVNGGFVVQSPKNKNSIRDVLLDDKTASILDNYITIAKPERIIFKKESDYLNQQTIRQYLQKLGTVTGLCSVYHLHPHALRHSHASNLRKLGYDEYIISKRLGNTPAVASSTYIHSSSDEMLEMVKKLRK